MKLKNLFTIASLTLLISVFLSCESPTKPERDAEKDAKGTNYQVPESPFLIDPGEKTSFGKNYTVLWSTADRATRYRIQESADSSFTTILSSANTDSTSTVFNHLVKSPTTYYYRVKGVNGDYESGWSNVVDITVNPQAPVAPDKLQATALSSSRITLSWTDNSDNELRFTIERMVSQGTYSVIDTVASDTTIYDDRDLDPDTRYYYRILAYNAGGNSGYSNETDAKTRTIYTLTLEVNQSGWGTTNPSIGAHSYDDGASVTVTATPASGYQFVSWTGSVINTLKSSTTATVISNMTVTANFEKMPVKQYTLTMAVNQADWGSTSPAAGAHSYDEGTVVTITAQPVSGCMFVNWTGNVANSSSATTTVTMSGDRTVTANFKRITYTLTMKVNTTGWGTTDPSIGSHSYDEGTAITVTATAASGYQFLSWTGAVADTANATTTLTMTGNMTVMANFGKIPPKQYTLTMAVNQTDWGSTSLAVGAHTYDEDTVVTVIATPASGYRFVSWTGNVADDNNSTTTVTINADKTVTANFEKIPVQTIDITMVSIPGGSFSMATNYTVTLSGFEMSTYETTQGQYIAVIGSNPSSFTGDDNLPVEWVSWWDAIRFCNALSAKAGLDLCYNESTGVCDFGKNGFRLPTEAEWEYACRAGTTTDYYTGNSESDLARAGWYNSNSGEKTHPVGQKTPNSWGLYDMHGNVWEWCYDWYGSYPSRSMTDPTGALTGSNRVIRGSSWHNDASSCRSAFRYYDGIGPDYRGHDQGFRVVRGAFTLQPTQYTLTMAVEPSSGGITSPSAGTHMYDSGVSFTITATPAAGYRFVNWTGNVADTNNSTTTVTINADMTLTANFEKIPVQTTDIIMVSIPGGTFEMGQAFIFEPVHIVTLSAFEMSAYEITQGQYIEVIGSNPSHFTGDDNLPVEMVSWWDAIKFCNAVSEKEGLDKCYNESTGACDFTKNGYRLPTEAEWEYACKAGTTTKYNTGDSESDLARAGWYYSNSNLKTHPTGLKVINTFGLYDMHGNVSEWCNDWFGNYGSESVTDPTGVQTGFYRVNRGGSWAQTANWCGSTYRHSNTPDEGYDSRGFRVVRRPGGVTY